MRKWVSAYLHDHWRRFGKKGLAVILIVALIAAEPGVSFYAYAASGDVIGKTGEVTPHISPVGGVSAHNGIAGNDLSHLTTNLPLVVGEVRPQIQPELNGLGLEGVVDSALT